MVSRGVALCVAGLMAACGGGGGGGSSAPSLRVTSDRTSLDFVGFAGSYPPSQSIGFTLTNGSGTYYAQIVPDRPADLAASFTPTSDTSATVSLMPLNSSPGQRSGSIMFRLCTDQACNQVAWSQSIPYRYAIFSIDNRTLAIDGTEGAAAAPKSVAITPADTNKLLSVSVRMNSESGWLKASPSAGDDAIQVAATAAGLAAGSYSGAVEVRIAGQANSPTLSIPVGYTVGRGFVAPVAAANLVLNAQATALDGSAAVAFNGGLSPAWTASSDQPWLVVDTPSGNGAGSLRYHADLSRLAELPNWSAASAKVTLRAPGLTDATLLVTAEKQLPEVYTTSPATVVAGRATTIRVFGRGLAQLSGVGRIAVAGAAGITGTINSDREAVLQIPALPAGRASVSVSNAAALPSWTGTLGAAPLAALPASTAPTVGAKRQALFDPTRNALFAISDTENTLVRFRYVGDQWRVDGLPVAAIGGLVMAPDRKTLYVGSGSSTVYGVDPDSLQIKSTHASPNPGSLPVQWRSLLGTAMTNDLRVWFGGSQWSGMGYFDLISGTFGSKAVPASISLYSPVFHAPGDGSKLYVVNPPMLSPRLPSYVYSPASDSFSAPANEPGPYNSVMYSENGSKLLVDREMLYDGNDFRLIGSVATSGAIGLHAILSPDGTRIYRMVTANNNTLVADRIEVYDTTQVQPGTSTLVKLGQIDLTTKALQCGVSDYDCDFRGALVISPLGDTLFWVGNQRLVVLPIPGAMSGALSAPPSRLKAAQR